jgi:hypothetical protein
MNAVRACVPTLARCFNDFIIGYWQGRMIRLGAPRPVRRDHQEW